jgi:hypothetical protein
MLKILYSSNFEKLWAACPPQMRHGKAYAFRCFERLKPQPGDVELIIASIYQHEGTKNWRAGYIPHLSTFLNQRRFEDLEPSQETKGAGFNSSWTEEEKARWRQEVIDLVRSRLRNGVPLEKCSDLTKMCNKSMMDEILGTTPGRL